MMRIFVYEYMTGGGVWECPHQLPTAALLLAEGQAMVQAITVDFCSLPEIEVWTTRDVRLPELHPKCCRVETVADCGADLRILEQLAAGADWTLLIAPETAGALARRCALVESVGGRLLSPAAALVEIATSKQATAELLASRGVPVPRGVVLSPGQPQIPTNAHFPAVLKPLDGCGSQDVRLIHSPSDLLDKTIDRPMRLEQFFPGLAASVALLCGPAGTHTLPACQQRLSDGSDFKYVGGRLPLEPTLDRRARQLAAAAVAALPEPRGYVGVDLVLGAAADGSDDWVIEINPRLTTSYVGLRAAARTNLAAAMLAVVQGEAPDLCFGGEPVEFAADGTVA